MIYANQFHKRTYAGQLTSTRISFLGQQICLFQDRDTISKIWNSSALSSPLSIQIYTLKNFFGVADKALAAYSGGNQAIPTKGLSHHTHNLFLRGFAGRGLTPITNRFTQALYRNTGEFCRQEDQNEWTENADFQHFFEHFMNTSLLESVFSPLLLKLNPSFVHDLLKFDEQVPFLARAAPSILYPKPYRIRDRLCEQLTKWYAYAQENFDEDRDVNHEDGSDPFWGSQVARDHHALLSTVEEYDEHSRAAATLGLAFG